MVAVDIGSGRVGLLVLSSAKVEVIVQRDRQQVSLGGSFWQGEVLSCPEPVVGAGNPQPL